jgi:crotonobetainyl-CoA:carnitine CoA-transferase CaiB-like acyl-CoA transferase
VVDATLTESILRILEWTVAAQDRLGITRGREGNRMANSAPLDNYPTADGTYVCVVAGSDTNFRRLCAAMGRPGLADDPEWATLAQRSARSDEINDLVAAWTSGRTAAEVEAACIAHEVPVATAYTAVDILADAHVAARGDLVTVDDPVAGPHLQQAPVPRLDGHIPAAPRPAPLLGEHNDEVWRELVGLSADELDRCRADGLI